MVLYTSTNHNRRERQRNLYYRELSILIVLHVVKLLLIKSTNPSTAESNRKLRYSFVIKISQHDHVKKQSYLSRLPLGLVSNFILPVPAEMWSVAWTLISSAAWLMHLHCKKNNPKQPTNQPNKKQAKTKSHNQTTKKPSHLAQTGVESKNKRWTDEVSLCVCVCMTILFYAIWKHSLGLLKLSLYLGNWIFPVQQDMKRQIEG